MVSSMGYFITGLIVCFGAVGGVETATNLQLIYCTLFAILGLTLLYKGMKEIEHG
jgi:hypothetical protein